MPARLNQWRLDSETAWWFYPACCVCKPQSITRRTALQPNRKRSLIRSMGMWEVSFLYPRQPVWLSGRSQTPGSCPQRCGNPSPRIERWRSKLQPTHCLPTWHQNCCRLPVTQTCHHQYNTPRDPVEDYVNSIVVDSLPSAITLQELLLASEYDPTLKTIKECLDTGDRSAAPAPFADLKEEICQKHGIILRNSRIVIPYAPHPRILQLAHEGNQGITKFKQHLRQRAWWPGIDIQAERVPSHGYVTLGNTEHVGRPFRERRVPSYFNDFLLS